MLVREVYSADCRMRNSDWLVHALRFLTANSEHYLLNIYIYIYIYIYICVCIYIYMCVCVYVYVYVYTVCVYILVVGRYRR